MKKEDEPKWQKAKEAALKSHKESDDGFYAIVTEIFKRMGGKPSGSAAKASDQSSDLDDGVRAVESMTAGEREGLSLEVDLINAAEHPEVTKAAIEAAAVKQETNQSMKESNDIIQCRSTYGTQLPTPKPWVADQPVTFIYAPEGLHTITAGFRKADTITISVVVDEETAPALQEAFDHLTATMPKQEPYADEDHEGRKATLRFSPGQTKFSWGKVKDDTGIVISGGCPTSYGAEAVNGKVYRSYSPEFASDADYSKATVDKETRHWTFPDGVRGSEGNPARLVGVNFVVGALTNRPAFRQMPPVRARQAEVEQKDTVKAAGTHDSVVKSWITRHDKGESYESGISHHANWASGVYSDRIAKHGDKPMTPSQHAWASEEALYAGEQHRHAAVAHEKAGNKEMAEAHKNLFEAHKNWGAWHSEAAGNHMIAKHPTSGKKVLVYIPSNEETRATDPTVSDTVQANWSDAARLASAEARKGHDLSLAAWEAHEKAHDTGNPEHHAEAEVAHTKAAEHWKQAGNPRRQFLHECEARNHNCKLWNQTATDPTHSDTVQATWSDAARRAAAEARKEKYGATYEQAGAKAWELGKKASFAGYDAHDARQAKHFKQAAQMHDSASKLHYEAAEAHSHASELAPAHMYEAHGMEAHFHRSQHGLHKEFSKLADEQAKVGGIKVTSATDSSPFDSIKSKGIEVLGVLASRRAQTVAVLEGAVPKPPPRKAPSNGAEVLAELAFVRDHSKVKASEKILKDNGEKVLGQSA